MSKTRVTKKYFHDNISDRGRYLQHGKLADDFFNNMKQFSVRHQTTKQISVS